MPRDDNKIDLDRLYSLEYGAHIDRIYGNLKREIESQVNELNRKGLLQSGYHENAFKVLHLNKAEEAFRIISELFKKIYCADVFDNEKKISLIQKIDSFAEGNLRSFSNSVNSSYTLISSRKESISNDYKRELNVIVSNQKKQVEIDFQSNKVQSEITESKDVKKPYSGSSELVEENEIIPPSIVTNFYWLKRKFGKHRLKIIIIASILLLLFLLSIFL